MSARAPELRLPRGVELAPLLAGLLAAVLAALLAIEFGLAALAAPLLIAVVVVLVRYPLLLWVVFLHIGLFKNQPVVEALPGDATVILGVLLALVCAQRVLSRRASTPPLLFVVPIVLIGVLMLISLNWTPVYDYGLSKTLRFLTLTSLGAFAPFCLIERRRDLELLLIALAGSAVLAGVLVLAFGSTAAENRLEFGGAANTIFTSRFLLSGAFILILAPVLNVFPRHRVLLPVLGLGLIAIAASIGSRGPMVGLVLALACTIVAAVFREPQRILPVLAVIAIAVAVFPFISLPETSAERLDQLAQNPVGSLEEDGRSRLYGKAIELATTEPLRGVGAGGFFLYSYVLTNREERYPHNVFLEAAAELGIVPALLLALSVAAMLMLLYRRAWTEGTDLDRNLVYVLGGVFLLNFFAAQFSGDFNDNRTFWGLLAVGWFVAVYGPAPGKADAASTR